MPKLSLKEVLTNHSLKYLLYDPYHDFWDAKYEDGARLSGKTLTDLAQDIKIHQRQIEKKKNV